jgi:hypothetical protein
MHPQYLQVIDIKKENIAHEQINIYRGLWSLYMLTMFLFLSIGLAMWVWYPIAKALNMEL